MKYKKDKGHAIAIYRALSAYSRSRGGYIDYQTALIYMLESMCRIWDLHEEKQKKHGNENVASFDMLYKAARKMANE